MGWKSDIIIRHILHSIVTVGKNLRNLRRILNNFLEQSLYKKIDKRNESYI